MKVWSQKNLWLICVAPSLLPNPPCAYARAHTHTHTHRSSHLPEITDPLLAFPWFRSDSKGYYAVYLFPLTETVIGKGKEKETDDWLEALSDLNYLKLFPQMTGMQSARNKHTAGLKCLGESRGRSRRKLHHSQQPSNMTDPKSALFRKLGRKECLMRCVVITEEGASPLRLQPSTQRAPFS